MLDTPHRPLPRVSQGSFHFEGNSFKRPPLLRSLHPIVHQTRLNHHSALEGQGLRLKRRDALGVNAVDRKV